MPDVFTVFLNEDDDDDDGLCHGRTSWGDGARGAAAPPATEIMWFFTQNACDLGSNNWENSLQNNAVGVFSKTRE